ncbi:MAG: ATP-binding protein [Syntrophorhabdales bacterium]
MLENILPAKTKFDNFEVDYVFPTIGHKIMLLNARGLYEEDTGTQKILLAIEDITERRQGGIQLEVSETRYRRLFETAQDGILIVDADTGHINEVNPFLVDMLGYVRDEVLGKKLWEIGAFKDAGASKAAFAELRSKGYVRYEDLPLTTRDGREIPVEFVSNVYLVDHHKVIQCNIRDITDRKRAEEALRNAHNELERRVEERTEELQQAYDKLMEETRERQQAEAQLRQAHKMEAVGTLTGGIAHDFNNILAAIIGFSELAIDKSPEGSPARRLMERVFAVGLRGRDLVKQILAFSRQAEQEKPPLKLVPVLKEALKLLRASLPSTVDIRTNLQGTLGFVLADPIQIQQIVMNLCTNAAHAMRRTGGTISIDLTGFSFSSREDAPESTMSPGFYARLSVMDTGVGVAPEILDHIFDPFFTTKVAGEGTGLGLSVVHGIVASHGGAITVSSEPGKGSTFTVYLPKLLQEQSRDFASGGSPIPRGHERILFIDDEEELAAMADEMLTDLGYRVTSKTKAREALALFRLDPSRFDLIITDQTMPEMTGVDLAKEILAIRADMPIIICARVIAPLLIATLQGRPASRPSP